MTFALRAEAKARRFLAGLSYDPKNNLSLKFQALSECRFRARVEALLARHASPSGGSYDLKNKLSLKF
jgi:hypothetical protein